MRWSFPLAVAIGVVAAAAVVTSEAPIEDPVWWYTNEQPPRLTIQGPSGPVRGAVQGTITLDPADRSHIVAVSLDGQPRQSADPHITLDTRSLPDGPHRVDVIARDTSRRQNQATATWTFVTDNSGPRLDVSMDPAAGPVEGRTFLIRITANEETRELTATRDGQRLELQSDGNGGLWVLGGVTPGESQDSVALVVSATDMLGNTAIEEMVWSVQPTEFPSEDLDLDPARIAAEERAAENARLNEIYVRPNGPPRWEGRFRVPVAGDITTEFATRRSYEYHPGTDFAEPLGAPVKAPANGVVVLTATVPARGRVVVLDHGAGVYSTYAHLSAFDVEEGAQVKAGQTIARIGSTGFSTGPHLHWELWVNGANVDPMEWTQRTFP